MKLVTSLLVLGVAVLGCAEIKKELTGPVGASGESITGPAGDRGSDGVDGYTTLLRLVPIDSCTQLLSGLDLDRDSDLSAGEVTQSAAICNGRDGADGATGPSGAAGRDGLDGADAPATAFTPVGIIDPCGDTPNVHDEVFIKLANGTLIASFSDNANGKNTRFSILIPGTNYQTTDGTNCTFSVDSQGGLFNEHQ